MLGVLCSLLLASGAGSRWTNRATSERRRKRRVPQRGYPTRGTRRLGPQGTARGDMDIQDFVPTGGGSLRDLYGTREPLGTFTDTRITHPDEIWHPLGGELDSRAPSLTTGGRLGRDQPAGADHAARRQAGPLRCRHGRGIRPSWHRAHDPLGVAARHLGRLSTWPASHFPSRPGTSACPPHAI